MQVENLVDGRKMNAGTLVTGLDAKQGVDEETIDALLAAWRKYGLLVFRGTQANADDQVRLTQLFGELGKHPTPELWVDGNPYLIELSGRTQAKAFVYDGKDLLMGRLAWHRDTAFMPTVCRGAMLRLEVVPDEGGETMFADTAAAYDALSDEMKQRIEGLEVHVTANFSKQRRTYGFFWDSAREATTEEDDLSGAADEAAIAARFPPVIQPLVIAHPETGRKCLYFSPWYTDHIVGMDKAESDALLGELDKHTTSEPFCYTHAWQPGDMVLWDNRRFLHAARGYHPRYRRAGFRTTLADPLLSGRYASEPAAVGA